MSKDVIQKLKVEWLPCGTQHNNLKAIQVDALHAEHFS